MKSLSKAHIENQTWKLLLGYIPQLWIHFVYLFIKVITTFRTCLHVVKGKNHRQSTSWIVAILNRKRYQIYFFFSFHDLYRLPDPELLIYYLLPEWKTASSNLYTVIGIPPYWTIPHIFLCSSYPLFNVMV